MADLSVISAQVERTEGVTNSAVALIQALADEIRNLPSDQGAIDALAARISAKADELAAAVAANPDPTP